jgi:hypothetical protein
MVLGRLDTWIVGSNPAQGMNVCLRLCVLCYPVEVEAFRRADPPSRESYKMSNWFIISEFSIGAGQKAYSVNANNDDDKEKVNSTYSEQSY